jgi:hypothetical protein
VLAGLLLLAVFTLSLPNDLLWQRVIEDAGHGPVFAALAIALLWMLPPPPGRSLRGFGQYVRVFAIAAAFGIVTELLQGFLPERNVSARDVLHDAAGAALGLAAFWIVERLLAGRADADRAPRHLAAATAVALAGFVLLAWQPLQCARAYAERARNWPTLLPLGDPAEAAFSKVKSGHLSYGPLPARYARPGDGQSLRLQFAAGARPGLQLFEPPPDWSGKDSLVIDVTNPSPRPLPLTLRVLDRTHDWSNGDRFNQRLIIPSDSRMSVRIALEAVALSPRKRRMDMTAIADVMLFARRPLDAGELYVTRVWLE